jgi:ferric-dicitrate binding protein FerR (iron transport regulator)
MSLPEAQQFVAQFIKGEYTPEEHATFLQWLEGATTEELAVTAELHESMHGEWVLPEGPSAAWVMQMEQKLNEFSVEEPGEEEEETVMGDRESVVMIRSERMRSERKRRWGVWVAAAAVVILLVTGTYIYVEQKGSKVGSLADREKLLSMTFVNPRGRAQKEMVLADGSKVWLNAGSVLKYPPQFEGSERLVELSGEAFFEVTGNSGSPFRVLIKDAEVEVLGTFFTVMAYDDEPENRTTVVNGAVKVTGGQQSVTLKPGEQAEIVYASPGSYASLAGGAPVVRPVDTRDVLAYKQGIYKFKATQLSSIMREIARTYDVPVDVEPNVGSQQIDGSFDLNKSLEITLEQLKAVTQPFKIQINQKGKTVVASSI